MSWTVTRGVLLALSACTPDLSHGFDSGTGGELPPGVIDATDEELWAAYDLDAGALVTEDDPTWDLAFRREEIRVDGGVSGPGAVEVAVIEGIAGYDGLAIAPDDGYLTDTDVDMDGVDERVFGTGDLLDDIPEWYDYDYATHTLSPGDRFYVVHTTEDGYVKLRFDEYYDDAGTAAMYTLSTAEVDPPAGAM